MRRRRATSFRVVHKVVWCFGGMRMRRIGSIRGGRGGGRGGRRGRRTTALLIRSWTRCSFLSSLTTITAIAWPCCSRLPSRSCLSICFATAWLISIPERGRGRRKRPLVVLSLRLLSLLLLLLLSLMVLLLRGNGITVIDLRSSLGRGCRG